MRAQNSPEVDRLRRQNAALLALTLDLRRGAGNRREELSRITEAAAEFLGVGRVGIWLFGADRRTLECAEAFDRESRRHQSGDRLSAEQFPRYLAACEQARAIDAHDAATDPRTAEFAADYLARHHIVSMLDSPILLGGQVRGVVCHEHCHERREWTAEDQAFSASIADLVALTLAGADRREVGGNIEALLEIAPRGILVVDGEGLIVRANRRIEQWFALGPERAIGFPVTDLLPGCGGGPANPLQLALDPTRDLPDPPEEVRLSGRRRDGSRFPVEVAFGRILVRDRAQAFLMVADITGRVEAEERLRRSEALYRGLVEDQTEFIARLGPDRRVQFGNGALAAALGRRAEELVGRSFAELVGADRGAELEAALLGLSVPAPVAEFTVIPSDGQTLPGAGDPWAHHWRLRAFRGATGELEGYQAVGRDVSQELRRQERLRETQRLEALAVLAGGLAHDLNNLLTPILAHSDLLVTRMPQDSSDAAALRQVVNAALRARELVRQILIFGRRGDSGPREVIRAAPFFRETMEFIRASSPARIQIEVALEAEETRVRAHPTDLYQVLSNLCTNAVQAMPAGGQLTVGTSEVQVDGRPTLQLLVRDTGAGIAPEVAPRVFEPYFTTKPSGQGTGLGLSVVRGLVEELGGEIDFQSRPGAGTTFVVRLPAVAAPEGAPTAEALAATARGTEAVLVVDDETTITAAIEHTLAPLGYRVTTCHSPNEALAHFERAPRAFDAAIVDATMPHMGGLELCSRLRRSRPDLPVVLISGFLQLWSEGELRGVGIDACLHKPFVAGELLRALREALAARPAHP
jgi:PAS domain S-box-containing protein